MKVTAFQKEKAMNEIKINYTPAKFDFDLEQVKQELDKVLFKYGELVVTEENLKDSKKQATELNKLANALNKRRLELEREYRKPFDVFKTEINGVVSNIKDKRENIQLQVKKFEDKQMEARKQVVYDLASEMYETYGLTTADWHKIEEALNEKDSELWKKKSTSNKARLDQVAGLLVDLKKQKDQHARDLETIKLKCESVGIPEATSSQVQALNNGIAIDEVLRNIEKLALQKEAQKASEEAELERIKSQSKQLSDGRLVTDEGEIKEIAEEITLTVRGSHEQITALAKFVKDSELKVIGKPSRKEVIK